jgi:hypothetical protein
MGVQVTTEILFPWESKCTQNPLQLLQCCSLLFEILSVPIADIRIIWILKRDDINSITENKWKSYAALKDWQNFELVHIKESSQRKRLSY